MDEYLESEEFQQYLYSQYNKIYECKECRKILRPKKGDCCVYCSYGDVPCPPIQEDGVDGNRSGCC